MTALEFRRCVDAEGKLAACRRADPAIRDDGTANAYIHSYFLRLMFASEQEAQKGNEKPCLDLRVAAAFVLWGTRLFDPRPSVVREVWWAIQFAAKSLVQGGGSLGKSYSAMIWFLMDYYEDPYYTTTKLISTTAGHAKSNTYATLARLHEATLCPMPGEVMSDYIGPDTKKRDAGIEIVAIPQGDDNKGALQGFHPKPRSSPHEIFGEVGRVRAFFDECEDIPPGLWTGLANMQMALSGDTVVKMSGAYNPKDISSKTANNAEPIEGWEVFDIETGVHGSNRWMSKESWQVVRLDGKRFENVALRQEVYPGFMTYSGYRGLEVKNQGNSPEFYTFGRGCHPPESAVAIIIAMEYINRQRGEFTFEGSTIACAGVDIAVDGRDDAVLTRGRYGRAISFRRMIRRGETVMWETVKFKHPRWAVQIDQQITLAKGDTKIVGDGIRRNCEAWGIHPENVALDRTGNGGSIHDYLRATWNDDIIGIDFNAAASRMKILEEDLKFPEDLYDGVVSEVWFAAARWLEFGSFCFAPSVRSDPLESELRSRRYVIGQGKKLKAEKKEDYKVRMGAQSPDHADSALVCLHGARIRIGALGSMVQGEEVKKVQTKLETPTPQHGIVDKVKWMQGPPMKAGKSHL